MLYSIQETGITFLNSNNNWPKPAEHKGTSIDTVLQQINKPHLVKAKLNKIGLHSIEQCTNYKNTDVLTWTQIPHTILHIPRGREPKWYKLITENIKQNLSNNNYNLVTPNPFTFNSYQTLEKASWAIKKNTSDRYIGQISSIKDNQATINHWTMDNISTKLKPCRGC
jgi:hypothetical protein